MVALWFHELTALDRVSVKPHASPVLHAVNHLLGTLDPAYLTTLRAQGGLQAYPSRRKDPDPVDFSTGSVGIGATATLWRDRAPLRPLAVRHDPGRGRFVSLLGDAELDEGAIWRRSRTRRSPVSASSCGSLDLNRQSLDRVVPDIAIQRLQAMFEAAGWQVLTLKWGRVVSALFEQDGGSELRARLESMPNEEYQRALRVDPAELAERIAGPTGSAQLRALLDSVPVEHLATAVRDLGGHDLGLLLDTFADLDDDRPTVVFAYTVKGRGLPTEGHPQNHSALLTGAQMEALAQTSGTSLDDPFTPFEEGSPARLLCERRALELARTDVAGPAPLVVPTDLGHPHRKPTRPRPRWVGSWPTWCAMRRRPPLAW